MRESARARQAWADYLAMGEERSLDRLLQRYQTGTEPAQATSLTRLKQWSTTFGWQTRLQAIADAAASEAEAAIRARRRAILESGLALDFERVDVLKRVAAQLLDELETGGRLWVRDVKAIGSGENAERVDIERFNAAEVEQLRGLLDDIAKEKGERVKKLEHAGPKGGPIGVRHSGKVERDEFDYDRYAATFASIVAGVDPRARSAAGEAAGEPLDPGDADGQAGGVPDDPLP
jgi:hypothetical protein